MQTPEWVYPMTMALNTLVDLAELTHRLAVAVNAAKAAGQLQREGYHRNDVKIDTKSNPKDLVTDIDHACDALIQAHLRDAFPNDDLITEETFQPGQLSNLDSAWIVDPLDGTTNFAHRFPHFAVSIAYVRHGQPLVGVVWDEMKQEAFTAITGQGAFLNDQPIQVSACQALNVALLSTGFPPNQTVQDNFDLFIRLTRASHGVRRAGAAALDLAYVASGRLDGFWEPMLAPWDVAAGALIVQEAGGLACGYDQQPVNLGNRHVNILASCSQSLLQKIIEFIQ
jgi:myo-inositol-1(or 4)-monophosphatase